MDLKQLSYFVAVADAGSFSRAAVALNLAQPTLSRQIGLLETELGQRLLDRTGRGAMPTEAGDALLVHARQMLDSADRAREALRELAASPGGRITVGLPPRVAASLSAELVTRFRERFPRAVITVSEGLSQHLREWLIAGRLDLALLFDPPPSPLLSCEPLLREPLLLVAPAQGPRLPARLRFSALADWPLVLPAAPNAIRSLVDAVARPRRIGLQVVAEVGSVQTVVQLVRQGVGCTVLPESALPPPGHGPALQRAAIVAPAIRNNLVLAWPKARPATRLMRETAALLKALDFSRLGSPSV
ncbi:LysR family transcriptional regulator [Aquincola tertiaricarbonis]|uniref:LysR family transcriptional regulator n=1 Tax=Aquincola tertiaricarbonis TaxID=391953 RepID=A0ABY4S5F0_AQUTE|nr:LysR family transcriptional regulator [Aquincola tertiaricarbonis]URI07106.1 LysR family transcriptional regulator [Aquincola tertiaricarbonis]